MEIVRSRVRRAGRDVDSVRVVAVTKTFGPEAVRAAARAGLDAVGENYLAELEAKRALASSAEVDWHFLGRLQSNKIARIVAAADVICTVSRSKELDKLAQLRARTPLYVQVDVTGAAQRNGAAPEQVEDLVTHGRTRGLNVVGLMTVAPPEPSGAARAFGVTAALAERCDLAVRSMGMSEDLELACSLGSTELRVGRALFGPRAPLAPANTA